VIYSLARAGYEDLTLARSGEVSVNFDLPEGASQGPSDWYLVYFHFRLEVEPDYLPDARAYVTAAINDSPRAMVKVESLGGNPPMTYWSAVQLPDGGLKGYSLGNTIEMRFVNYLTYGAVKPGTSTLTFKLDPRHGMKAKRLVIMNDTGILKANEGPPDLALSVRQIRGDIAVGHSVKLDYDILNHGLPAKSVRVVPTAGAGLAVVGEPTLHETVVSHATGTVEVRAEQPGIQHLSLRALADNAEGSGLQLEFDVGEAGTPHGTGLLTPRNVMIWAGGVGLALVVISRLPSLLKRRTADDS
jgi:hypothetical protein